MHISSLSSIVQAANNSKFGHVVKNSDIVASNVLIAMIGIGNFEKRVFPNLIGVSRDYCNVKYTFNYKRGYHIMYKSSGNETRHITTRIKKHKDIKDNFKLYWTKKDILDFSQAVKNIISSYEYDCLMLFISCHGDSDNIIYDSKGDEVKILDILNHFTNTNCPELQNKPKIAVLDFCRGSLRMKTLVNSDWKEVDASDNSSNSNNSDNSDNGNTTNNTQNSNEEKKQENKANVKNTIERKNVSDEKENNSSKNNNNNSGNSSYIDGFSDFREIYANSDGYVTVDGGLKGGYLIRSFTKVFNYDKFFNQLTLNEIIMQTKKLTDSLLGPGHVSGAAAVIEDIDRLAYSVKFENNHNNTESFISEEKKDSSSDHNNKEESEYKVSEITQVEDKEFANEKQVKNPLIVLLFIGEYSKNSQFEDVIAAQRDYILAKNCFNKVRGYSTVYMRDDKKKSNNNDNENKNNNNNNNELKLVRNRNKMVKDCFKLEWSCDEIENFNERIISKVLNDKDVNYDGLIYIISGHGDSDDRVFDSYGEEYGFAFILNKFDNKSCRALRGKPKIFIIDTDRGNEEAKLHLRSINVEDKKEMKIETTTDKKLNATEKEKEKEKETEKENKSEDISKKLDVSNEEIWNERYYCKFDNFRIIYSNTKGYKKNDLHTNKKGSCLIRAITKVFNHDKTFLHKRLTDIITATKSMMVDIALTTNAQQHEHDEAKEKEKNQVIQVVEDCNQMKYYVTFEPR